MTEAQRVQDLQYELSRELVETRLQMAEALDRRIAQGYRMRLRRNPEPDGADEDGEELERAVEKFLVGNSNLNFLQNENLTINRKPTGNFEYIFCAYRMGFGYRKWI